MQENEPSNAVLGIIAVSKGGLSGTVTDVRIILQAALKLNASGLIVCHNHPSGNFNPSESDTKITQKIKEAGNIMDIQLINCSGIIVRKMIDHRTRNPYLLK
jgi:DNA repair protein RadC